MSLRVQEMTPARLPWLCARAGCAMSPHLRGIEAVDARGVTRGAMGFDGWLGNAAQMHIALDSPAALRALLRPCFQYIYGFAGKDIALGVIPAHNQRSLRLCTAVGFRVVHRIRDGQAPGDDVIVLELRKQDCRWYEEETHLGKTG